jgi:LPS export ABC transporter protein LptC
MMFFVSCTTDFNAVDVLVYEGQYPDESAQEIEIIYSENGIINCILFAPVLNKYAGKNPYTDCPQGVTLTSFDSEGNKSSELTANYAISFEKLDILEAHNRVVIHNFQKNEIIETEKIVWDKRNKRIYSDVEIKQTKADSSVNIGDGLDANDNFTKYSIRNPRGIVVTPD